MPKPSSGSRARTRRIVPGGLVLAALVSAPTGAGAAVTPAAGPGPGLYYVTVTYPVRESCYDGRAIQVPGLDRSLPQDYVLKWMGLSTQWEGVLRDGARVHLTSDGDTAWLNAAGRPTRALPTGRWSAGLPAWRDAGWRNAGGGVTYQRADGSWSNGRGTTFKPLKITVAAGRPTESNRLRPWRSVAVDKRFVPLGSTVVIPAYADRPNAGRFTAINIGTTVKGEHLNVRIPSPACGQNIVSGWLPARVITR